MQIDINTFYNCDCMELMKELPDKSIDLAIVDPPYGDVPRGGYMNNGESTTKLAKMKPYHRAVWKQNKPSKEYFDELKRVSKNRIIWGGNYFTTLINDDSPCWIIWDKDNGNTSFSDFEIAYTSFREGSRIFRYRWNGMLQQNMKQKEFRIHPTQKPVALYEWILSRYASKGDLILDTHCGSASSLVACHKMGFDFIGCEIDEKYYRLAIERLKMAQAQLSLF